MEFCALASGSSGNCFYVASEKSAVLVDVGISAKQVLARLAHVKGEAQKIKAILITHEHSDHIRGVDVLARKLHVPIFATKKTLHHRFICSDASLLHSISSEDVLKIQDLLITAFTKSHSAADPVSFSIKEKKHIAVITDAGHACKNIQEHVAACDFLCIESNHDEHMLEIGPYTPFHKAWVKSDKGHLSNKQAALCVRTHASAHLQQIVLSHLSKINNTPTIALQTFRDILKERDQFHPQIAVSVREEPTQLFLV